MNKNYDFFIAGRTRNRDKILEICDLFDSVNKTYYCFLKNEESFTQSGLNIKGNPYEMQDKFEKMYLNSKEVRTIFEEDMEGEKNSENFLLVLPAGKSAHIEAGVAYGLGKKCYAIGEYEATDTLYNIFEEIFSDEIELEKFLKKYSVR